MHSGEMIHAVLYADNIGHIPEQTRSGGMGTDNQGVGITALHRHQSEISAVEHQVEGCGHSHSLALTLLEKQPGVAAATVLLPVVARIYDLDSRNVDAEPCGPLPYHLLVAEQHGTTYSVAVQTGRTTHHGVGIALRKDNPLRSLAHKFGETAYHGAVVAHEALQTLLIFLPVGDGTHCDSRLFRAASHGRSHTQQQPGVECLWQDILRTELDVVHAVCLVHNRWHRFLRQVGYGMDGRDLHGLVDCGCSAVERASEDIRETDDVVYLVRIIAASRGHNHVGAHRAGQIVGYLRIRIRQGEDYRILRHRLHHLGRHDFGYAEAEENVGSHHCLLQGVDIPCGGELTLLRAEGFSIGANHPFRVAHHYIRWVNAKGHIKARAAYCGRARSVDHEPHLAELLTLDLDCVEESGARYYRRSVLVVMHYGNIAFLLQPTLNLETFRRLDILQVDASECRRHGLDCRHKSVRVGLVDLYVE